MNTHDFALFALQIAVMLGCAVVFGQLMRRFGQPAVLGEMLGGILLGPTLFGALAPALYAALFESSPGVAMAREASIKLGMLLFLFIAGLEIDLADFWRLGKKAVLIGLVGTLLPIAAGVLLVYQLPLGFWGIQEPQRLAFALFVGMNLANSANPVIARILLDLGLLRHEIGTIIMTATIVDDLVNWTLFAIILSQIAPIAGTELALEVNLLLVAGFFAAVLGIGRWAGPRLLPLIRSHVAMPSGFIAVTIVLILVVSSLSEALGIHAFLGAFLIGAALGGPKGKADDQHEAYQAIAHFSLSYFAPIYFVSMGMNANFATHFDAVLVLLIFAVACVSKIGAVLLGARLAGMRLNRQALAIGFGLNVRGATGIILAGVGLENGLIDERIFVAIVVMSILTSLLSAPVLKRLVGASTPVVVTSAPA